MFENLYKNSKPYKDLENEKNNAELQLFNLRNENNHLQNQLSLSLNELETLKEKFSDLKKNYASLELENKKQYSQADDYLLEIFTLENKNEQLQKQLSEYKINTPDFSVYEKQIDEYKKQLEYFKLMFQLEEYHFKQVIASKHKLFRKQYNEIISEYTQKRDELISEYTQKADTVKLRLKKKLKRFDEQFFNDYTEIRNYISFNDFMALSIQDVLILALKRYEDIYYYNSSWLLGLKYERYIGYLCEIKGYETAYHGAINKYKDRGVDIFARKGKHVYLIQCKHWKSDSLVRENTVAQIIGIVKDFSAENPSRIVQGVVVTSANLDDSAKALAERNKIAFFENIKYDNSYPKIKCHHSSKGNEKIYHTPIDQMYDKMYIKISKGDVYVHTIEEAEELGFRHAHRWTPNEKSIIHE